MKVYMQLLLVTRPKDKLRLTRRLKSVCVCVFLTCKYVLMPQCTFQIVWGSGYTSSRDLPSHQETLFTEFSVQQIVNSVVTVKKVVMDFFSGGFRNPGWDILTSDVNIYLYHKKHSRVLWRAKRDMNTPSWFYATFFVVKALCYDTVHLIYNKGYYGVYTESNIY